MGNATREGSERAPQSKVLGVIGPAAGTPQSNLIPPWRDGQVVLVRAIVQARSARGSRKPLRIESPNALAYATRQRRSSADAYTRVRRYLVRLSLRALNELHADGTSTPEAADLAAGLEHIMREYHRGVIRDQAQGEPRPAPQQRWQFLESESLERCCAHAADAGLSAWSPRYIADQAAASKVGGAETRIAKGDQESSSASDSLLP